MDLSFKEFEQQNWEKVADAYHEGFGRITANSATALVDNAKIKRNDKVLDIACGPGYVAAFASKKSKAVIGIDFSSAMIIVDPIVKTVIHLVLSPSYFFFHAVD